MCLSIPAKVVEMINPQQAFVEVGGVLKSVQTTLIEDLKVGDYVLIHVGVALSRIDEAEAQYTLGLFEKMKELGYEP